MTPTAADEQMRLRGLGGGLGFAGLGAKNGPIHIWPQLFASHTSQSLYIWAVLCRDAVLLPLINDSVAAQPERLGKVRRAAHFVDSPL